MCSADAKARAWWQELIERIITVLSYHIQKDYWLHSIKETIPLQNEVVLPHSCEIGMSFSTLSLTGCLISGPFEEGIWLVNVSPARMDFRSFLVDNCIAIWSSLVTPAQATAVMDLIEERWEEWIGEMPLKIIYPALEGHEWRIVTGFDPKNTRRSYLIGESWPG